MSFLKIGDAQPVAIKSGGTTRARQVVVVDMITLSGMRNTSSGKVLRRAEVAALVTVSKTCKTHLSAIMEAVTARMHRRR